MEEEKEGQNQEDEEVLEEAIPESSYCVFKVGEKEFLMPLEVVKEVIDITQITPVPLAPDYIYGVVPLRGKIVPAVDLSKIYTTGNPSYHNLKLVVADVEVGLLRESISEHVGFIAEGLPYFVTFSSDIPSDDTIDINNFFKMFRIKES